MKVSVIIPTFNRADMLCDCVQSVLSSTYTDIEATPADYAAMINAHILGEGNGYYIYNWY